jgi:hypothetical protein
VPRVSLTLPISCSIAHAVYTSCNGISLVAADLPLPLLHETVQGVPNALPDFAPRSLVAWIELVIQTLLLPNIVETFGSSC